jgi:hypothetical protein
LTGRIFGRNRLLDFAVDADDEGVSLCILIPLILRRAKSKTHAAVLVRKQLEGEPSLPLEGFVGFDWINRNTKDHSAVISKVLDSITEPNALLGSAGCVGFREKPKHRALAAKVYVGDRTAFGIEGAETGAGGASR